ncbi:MAG: chromate transporter [Prevotella sp.]|nr:chromate transporter [Prevotella sp.]MDD6819265.1 chromate transporter [Prevotella sp.]MDY4653445.1 chromate transporter [Prevotella sp.]
MDKFYSTSFKTFFKIGVFTLGGGYAMIPIIESEVVERKKWLTKEDFVDTVAIAQTCPGVFAINLSVFIGYKMRRLRGAIFTALGTALPSFLIILIIAMFFHQFEDNKVVAAIFRGIRPAVVALIAVPTFKMAKTAKIGWSNCWIPVACALAIWAMKVSPILIILLAAAGGYVYGKYIKPTE